MTNLERVTVAVIAILCVLVLFGVYDQWSDCKESKGVLVRGLFLMECVKT